MATPNYGYEKRQRELAKKAKKQEKLKRKADGLPDEVDDAAPGNPADALQPGVQSPETPPTAAI